MNGLVNKLIKDGYLKTDAVIEAFSNINRVDFLPVDLEKEAYSDVALPIGFGQTISQPATVATMLEFLDAKKGQNILDVGSGSGWTTALLAHIVGEKGKITALERIESLVEWGKGNVAKYGFIEKGIAEFYVADAHGGFLANAPYDRILVSASAGGNIPEELKKQLKIGGKMVIPVLSSLHYLEKRGEDDFYEEKYPGFSFVPLV